MWSSHPALSGPDEGGEGDFFRPPVPEDDPVGCDPAGGDPVGWDRARGDPVGGDGDDPLCPQIPEGVPIECDPDGGGGGFMI